MDLNKLTQQFLKNCRRKELSIYTIRAYKNDLNKFKDYYLNQANELSPPLILSWMDDLQIKDLSATSRKRHMATLRVFCQWLEEQEHIKRSPFNDLKIKIRTPKKLPRNIQKNILKKIFSELNKIDNSCLLEFHTLRIALELLISTGMRIGELCNIKINDLDINAGALRVTGKGARERTVFILDQDLKKLTVDYIKKRAPFSCDQHALLLLPSGHAATPDYIRRKLHKFTKQIGIHQPITPHMFRHSAATLFLENGVDIRFVQRLLGHASLSTTEIYTHVTDTSLKAALMKGKVRKQLSIT